MNPRSAWPTTRITLIAQIRDPHDAAAWSEFVDLYGPVVCAYCRQRGFQHADTENIAQEVFGRVSRAIRSFEYNVARGRFRSWLGLITHQQMLRYREALARAGQELGNGLDDQISDGFEAEAEGVWMEGLNAHIYARALDRVRPEFDAEAWSAFLRVWHGEERPAAVARSLHKDPGWVYQVKYRVVERLKREVERMTDDVAVFHRR
jgi:RNA polymerase sigma-70 factor (ECF subfamily)